MSKMMTEKDKQGMTRDFEGSVNLLSKEFTNRYLTYKVGKFKTDDGEAVHEMDENKTDRGLVKIYGMDIKNFIPYIK